MTTHETIFETNSLEIIREKALRILIKAKEQEAIQRAKGYKYKSIDPHTKVLTK